MSNQLSSTEADIATCQYCSKHWSYGHPAEIEAYFVNICPEVSKDIKDYWQELLSDKIISYNNPFIANLFNTLNSAYVLPSCITFSNRLLEQETAKINLKVDAELEKCKFLTLALGGWLSPSGNSIYNYIISTTDQHEYLITLKDYSKISQTEVYITNEIESIIVNIEVKKVAEIVTNSNKLVYYEKDLTQQKLRNSVNNSIFSDINEHLLNTNQEYQLSNNQEITLSEIVEQ
ncbi:19857_t:CDS:2, partial [Cetraspora pellucida]